MKVTFTKKTTMIATTLALLSCHTLVLAKGIDTGNGDDKLTPFAGFKSKAALEKNARVVPQENRLINKISVDNQFDYPQDVLKSVTKMIGLSSLLDGFSFPADREELNQIYNKAVAGQGDLTSLQDTHAKDYLASMLKDPKRFIYPIGAIHNVTEGIKLNLDLNVNRAIQEKKCDACSVSDYKEIPTDGIDLKVNCAIQDLDDVEYLGATAPAKYFDLTSDFKIYGNIDHLQMKIPVITYDMAESMRLKFCDQEERIRLHFAVTCSVVPATSRNEKIEARKMTEAFGTTNIGLKPLYISFYNPKIEDSEDQEGRVIRASKFNNANPLMKDSLYKHSKKIWIGDRYIPTWPSSEELIGYKFDYEFNGTSINTVYGTDAELTDLVRRTFINSYNKTEF